MEELIMRNTEWNIKTVPNEKDIKAIDLSVDSDILKILYLRGIRTKKAIRDFLNPKLENIRNPYGLYDMEKSVNIILILCAHSEKTNQTSEIIVF